MNCSFGKVSRKANGQCDAFHIDRSRCRSVWPDETVVELNFNAVLVLDKSDRILRGRSVVK